MSRDPYLRNNWRQLFEPGDMVRLPTGRGKLWRITAVLSNEGARSLYEITDGKRTRTVRKEGIAEKVS